MQYQTGGGVTPLRVSGDYPQWNYMYTGTVAGTNGCTSSMDVYFAFNPIPAAPTAGNNSPICAGANLNLTASDVTGGTYAWTGPNGFTSALQNPSIPNATTAASGTYSVTVTVSGCASVAGTTVATVNALPDATITAAAAVCALSTGNTAIGARRGEHHLRLDDHERDDHGGCWDGERAPPTPRARTSPVSLGVTVTTAGCPNTGSASVTVNQLPVATASNNGPVYTGDPVTLTGGPDGMTLYSWTGPDSWTSDQQSPTRNPAVAGVYSLTVTDGNGCASAPATTTVVVNPPPIVSDPPIVTSPIYAGATTVYGSSVEPPGSTITVYVNGSLVGTTLVLADGTWSFAVPPLSEGDRVWATAQAVGELVSGLSNVVVVCGRDGSDTAPHHHRADL